MQRLTLPPAPVPPYIGGAGLFSAAAYPLQSEADERARAHGMLCAAALRMTDPKDAPFRLDAVSSFHAALADEGELVVERFLHRIDIRDKAGAIVTPAIWQAMHGELERMPKGMARASMASAFSKAAALDLVGNDDRNFRKRHLGPSLPVMHLICSFHFALWQAHKIGRQITWVDILFNRDLQRVVVAGSNVFLPHVIQRWPMIKTSELWLFQTQNLNLGRRIVAPSSRL